MRLPLLRFATLATLVVAGCGPGAADGGQPPARNRGGSPNELPALSHDFGVIAHGKAAQHDFDIDTRAIADDLVCIGVRVDCSCARYRMLLRDRSGQEREIGGQPQAENCARDGEVLVVRMQIDTAQKEAVDLPPVQSRGTVLLQHMHDPDPEHRLYLPLLLRYGIDSPVRLRPFAILDFEAVPMSMPRTVTTWMSSDLRGQAVQFGTPRCDDLRLRLELQPDGDAMKLSATFTPEADKPPGVFRTLVTVPTDLPDHYELHLAAVGKVIPDLEAQPMAKLSLGAFDFAKPGTEQFINVFDHDRHRPAAFVVDKLVDSSGRDASSCFRVRLEPLSGDDRGFRLFVRYEGGLQPPNFRGELVLAKQKGSGPVLRIELVAFHRGAP